MIKGLGSDGPLPAAHGGGLGRVVALRTLPGTTGAGDGQALAEVTYQKPPQPAARKPTGAVAPLLDGETVTAVQAVALSALPPGPDKTQARDQQRDQPGLNQAEQAQVEELSARDAAVRSEEESHAALAGAYAGPIQYEYAAGPDGRLYVVNGSVSMSTAGISNPEQLASALGAMQSAGRVAAGTSVQDTLSANAAGRGLTGVMMALSESEKSITVSRANQAYAAAERLGQWYAPPA